MSNASEPRKPRVFRADDPSLTAAAPEPAPPGGARTADPSDTPPAGPPPIARPTLADLQGGIRWGAILMSGIFALAMLAAGLWFARFVSVALARDDWIGWTATALLALVGLAALAILIREIVGLSRLGRLSGIRRAAERAMADRDVTKERAAIADLKPLFAARPDCRWALRRLDEHARDVRDPGDLMRLADRDLIAPLDLEARRLVMTSAKRVGVVTAMSPLMLIAVIFVLVENVRMLRAIATLYGGRPGTAGALRLGRMVVAHLLASGGVALTEDLLGQFVGQDMLRRLSRRLGEGAFNGTLTARIGAAGIGIIRPLPFIEASPVRVRDLLAELFRRPGAKSDPKDAE